MKVGIKGKGENIKWVDEKKLDIYKEIINNKEYIAELEQKYTKLLSEFEKVKLENVEIIKGLISR